MSTRRVVFFLTFFFMLTACSHLTSEEKIRIAEAKDACNYIDVGSGELTLKMTPIINGEELPNFTARLGKNTQADSVIYQTLWHQNVCIIQALNPQKMSFSKVYEWDRQVKDAFVAVPDNLSGTYDEKIRWIQDKREGHVKRLEEKEKALVEVVGFNVFAAAIPKDNFLKVETLYTEITFPENYLIKGKNVAKSTISGDLKPGEFSTEVRPALQAIRNHLGAYARGRATEHQLLVATVASIYDVAANKVRERATANAAKGSSDVPAKEGGEDRRAESALSPGGIH